MRVGLFVPCYVDAFEPEVGIATLELLERFGLDFVDVVVHVQHAEDREFYDLERLWQDCPVIELELDEPADA